MSHFPKFDQLEQVLTNWPRLFDVPPTGTQPMVVQGETLIVLCVDADWVGYITANQHLLVDGLRELLVGHAGTQIERIQAVLATPTELFLARQLVVVQAKLRDVELGF